MWRHRERLHARRARLLVLPDVGAAGHRESQRPAGCRRRGFQLAGDDIVSGGLDLTKTVRYRHLIDNPQATIVIDDLAGTDPFTPRGVKINGSTNLEDDEGSLRVRIRPTTIWSWGINESAPAHFAGVEKRQIPSD